jgi:hypothetical protein
MGDCFELQHEWEFGFTPWKLAILNEALAERENVQMAPDDYPYALATIDCSNGPITVVLRCIEAVVE